MKKEKENSERDFLAEIEALIAEKYKDNPEELKKIKRQTKKVSVKKVLSKPTKSKEEIKEASDRLFEELTKSSPDISFVHQLIMEYGADVNMTNDEKGDANALFVVSASNNTELIEILIGHGADINFQNKFGVTPLQTAVVNENVEAVRTLLKMGAIPDLTNHSGYTALLLASEGDEVEIVKMLLEAGANPNITENDEDGTALHRTVSKQSQANVEIAKLLIQGGADLNYRNTEGNTALHWASGNNKLTIAKILVEAGAEVNVRNEDGLTPLVWAMIRGNQKVAKFLASKGGEL